MGIAERLFDSRLKFFAEYLMALCNGSTAPGAWAQKVFPGLRIDTVAQVFRYRPADLPTLQRTQNFHAPRQTVAARRHQPQDSRAKNSSRLRTSDTI